MRKREWPAARTADSFGFGDLIWAAGGRPRRLTCPGAELAGIHLVRNRADVDAIRRGSRSGRRVTIIGGGYIGLEAAAILNKLGKQVVIVEALDRVLARVAGIELSRFIEAQHRSRGVEIRLSRRSSGSKAMDASAPFSLLAANGSKPTWSSRASASTRRSTLCSLPAPRAATASTSTVSAAPACPDIYAIGDCAAHESRFGDGRRLRIESVQNAHDQAGAAVRTILGSPEPFAEIPWFWSNQYDLRLQTVGLSTGFDDTIVRGSPDHGSWSLIYLRQGRVVALDCVNATKDYVQGRKLIAAGACFDPARLADNSVPLKELV